MTTWTVAQINRNLMLLLVFASQTNSLVILFLFSSINHCWSNRLPKSRLFQKLWNNPESVTILYITVRASDCPLYKEELELCSLFQNIYSEKGKGQTANHSKHEKNVRSGLNCPLILAGIRPRWLCSNMNVAAPSPRAFTLPVLVFVGEGGLRVCLMMLLGCGLLANLLHKHEHSATQTQSYTSIR